MRVFLLLILSSGCANPAMQACKLHFGGIYYRADDIPFEYHVVKPLTSKSYSHEKMTSLACKSVITFGVAEYDDYAILIGDSNTYDVNIRQSFSGSRATVSGRSQAWLISK